MMIIMVVGLRSTVEFSIFFFETIHQACIIHDLCYSTIGANRTLCDRWVALFVCRHVNLHYLTCYTGDRTIQTAVEHFLGCFITYSIQNFNICRQLRENVNSIHFLHKDGWDSFPQHFKDKTVPAALFFPQIPPWHYKCSFRCGRIWSPTGKSMFLIIDNLNSRLSQSHIPHIPTEYCHTGREPWVRCRSMGINGLPMSQVQLFWVLLKPLKKNSVNVFEISCRCHNIKYPPLQIFAKVLNQNHVNMWW